MAADASIFAQYLRPVKSVADYGAEMDASQQNALQLAALKMKAQQDQQGFADEQTARSAFTASNGDPAGYRNALVRAGLVKQVQAFDDKALAAEKDRALIGKTNADTAESKFKIAKQRLDVAGQAFGYVKDNPTPENAMQVADYLASQGIWTPEIAAQAKQKIQDNPTPENVRALATQAFQNALTAKDQLPQYFNQNRGGSYAVTGVNPVTGQARDVQTATITQSADNAATQATSIENNKRSTNASLANAAATRDVASATREANANTYDADRGVLVNRATGLARPAATLDGKPLGAKDKPLPEGAQKQIIGTRNLQDAVDGYQTVLAQWGKAKMLSPDARAEMGNAYNNMMLQAKEAYNLGVLNGPDYAILQSVVKDPTQWTSAITSNDAMSNQATKLKEIAANIERTAMESHGKNYTPRKPTPQANDARNPSGGQPAKVASDAEYNALPSGATFVGPDGKTRRKP